MKCRSQPDEQTGVRLSLWTYYLMLVKPRGVTDAVHSHDTYKVKLLTEPHYRFVVTAALQTCGSATAALLSCISEENNWASENLSANQQEPSQTWRGCEEKHNQSLTTRCCEDSFTARNKATAHGQMTKCTKCKPVFTLQQNSFKPRPSKTVLIILTQLSRSKKLDPKGKCFWGFVRPATG